MEEKFLRTDKIFHHPGRLEAYLNCKLVRPVTVELHLTNKCNVKCKYCIYADRRDQQTIPLSQAGSIIDKLNEMGVKGLTFSGGGEPTMHNLFVDIVQYVCHNRMDAGLITNGIKLPFPSKLWQMLTWIRFSVDAHNKDLYKSIKGVDRFEQVESNIKQVVAIKAKLDLPITIGYQMVITEDNYKYIIEILEHAFSLGVDYFQFRPLETGIYTHEQAEVIAVARKRIANSTYRIHVVDSWYKWKELSDGRKYTDCPGVDFIGAVDAYGDFYMCCHHVQNQTACYGNLATDNVGVILHDRKNIQDRFDYSKCPVACRGSVINRRLKAFNNIQHVNFL